MIRKLYKNQFFSSTIIYTLSTVINSAIPFLLIPILTRHLTSSDYGIISIYTVLVAIVTPFIGYSIHSSVTTLMYSKDKNKVPQYIGNCFYILFVSTFVTSLILIFIYKWIENEFKIPTIWIWSSIFLAFNQFIYLFPLTIWQANNKPLYFGIFQIALTILNFSITLVLVIYFKKNWVGRIEAQLISSLIFAIISLIILFKNNLIVLKFNLKQFIDGIRFGVPLIFHVMGGIFLSIINRFFIAKYVGLSEAGLFFIAFQLTSIINIFTGALNTAYVPWLFSKLELNDINENRKIVSLTYKYFLFLITTSFLFAIILPHLLHIIVGKDYYSSQKYFNWLIIGCISNGMYLMVTNYIVYAKKTFYLAWSTFSSSLITVALNFILIKKFGAIGASISNAIGFTVLFLMTWFLSINVYRMPWFNFNKN